MGGIMGLREAEQPRRHRFGSQPNRRGFGQWNCFPYRSAAMAMELRHGSGLGNTPRGAQQ